MQSFATEIRLYPTCHTFKRSLKVICNQHFTSHLSSPRGVCLRLSETLHFTSVCIIIIVNNVLISCFHASEMRQKPSIQILKNTYGLILARNINNFITSQKKGKCTER